MGDCSVEVEFGGNAAPEAEVASTPGLDASQNVSTRRAKWTGGVEDVLMDCPVDAVWELASDWANWQRWWPGNPTFELREGENRKAGCLRYAANVRSLPGAWVNERLLAIDNEKHCFSYTVEANEVYGGLTGYIAKAQFRGTDDGKTLVEFFKYEVEPVTNQTPESWLFIMTNVYMSVVKDLERGAQRLAAGLDPKPEHTSRA
ncbi:hypothetical protein M758_12G074700 [Ceratodon purpureus]|nr:hypothetical protein M758_12G074700 [Ceratodon purpureus]